MVRRPVQLALALCRRLHHLVIRTRADGPGYEPFGITGLPHSPRSRRIDLSSRRDEDRQPVICAQRTWPPLWSLRLRNPNGTGPRGPPRALALSPFRWRRQVLFLGFTAPGWVSPLVRLFSRQL